MTQEVLKLSQEALAGLKDVEKQVRELIAENKALKEALRENAMREVQRLGQEIEQEPVAWMWDVNNGAGYSSRGIGFYQTDIPFAKHTPLYTTPPQRTWVGLTDEEISEVLGSDIHDEPSGELRFIRAIEAKLKEKNT